MAEVFQVDVSPVEVFWSADRHQAVRVGQLGEAADLVVFLECSSHSHGDAGDDSLLILNPERLLDIRVLLVDNNKTNECGS